jgi:hypothetical protein
MINTADHKQKTNFLDEIDLNPGEAKSPNWSITNAVVT